MRLTIKKFQGSIFVYHNKVLAMGITTNEVLVVSYCKHELLKAICKIYDGYHINIVPLNTSTMILSGLLL